MLIDLRLNGKKAVIFGGGKQGEKKAKKLLGNQSQILVVSRNFTDGIIRLAERGEVQLLCKEIRPNPESIDPIIKDSFIVFAATDDEKINRAIVDSARKLKILVCAVDMPLLCDFYSLATFQKKYLRVGICTDGKSPLVSGQLRRRFENIITDSDLRNIELQHQLRTKLKTLEELPEKRSEILKKLYNNKVIQNYIEKGNFDKARSHALSLLEQSLSGTKLEDIS